MLEQNRRRKDEYVYQILSLARSLIVISQGTVGKETLYQNSAMKSF